MRALAAALLALLPPPGGAAPLEPEFAAAVDSKRLLQTVRELVAIGARMGGTPSGDAAADYHAGRFRAAGYEPVVAADPPLPAFQPLQLSAQCEVAGGSIDLKDGTLALHTPGIAATRLPLRTKPAVDDAPYALLAEESAWREAATGAHPPRVVLVECRRRIESSTPVLHQPKGVGATVLTVSAREADALRGKLADAAAAVLAITAKVFDQEGSPRTVYADLPARDAKSGKALADAPILLFCAHGDSDSGGPGADDNGSGDAVVQELAADFRRLAQEKGLALPFTLRFAVWGAEIHSSQAYRERAVADGTLARHLGVVNFDEAGTGAERDCVYFEADNLPRNLPLIRLGLAVASDYVDRPGWWTEYTSNRALGGADSYVFQPGWQGGGGAGDLPAITIFTAAWGRSETPEVTPGFASPHWKGPKDQVVIDYSKVYHETGDRPENTTELEPWDMVWVARAAGLLTLRLADSKESVKTLLAR